MCMLRILSSGCWLLGMLSSAPEKEIVKIIVNGLNPDIFRQDIYSRPFETLVNVMDETRHDLTNYRDIIEISNGSSAQR